MIELHQPMTPAMDEIQTAILECMEATLAEVKRSNTSVRSAWSFSPAVGK